MLLVNILKLMRQNTFGSVRIKHLHISLEYVEHFLKVIASDHGINSMCVENGNKYICFDYN